MTQRSEQQIRSAIYPLGPTPAILPVIPTVIPRAERREIAAHIGLFLDRTYDQREWYRLTLDDMRDRVQPKVKHGMAVGRRS